MSPTQSSTPRTTFPLSPPFEAAAIAVRRNAQQSEAFDFDGNCVVLAGPGSGKTKVLTVKLAREIYRLRDGPQRVACITYNNECVREIRRRLLELGVDEGQQLYLGTAHSFALRHIVFPFAAPCRRPIPNPLRIAVDADWRPFLNAAVESEGARLSEDILERFKHERRQSYGRLSPRWNPTHNAMHRVIERFETSLHEHGYIDFEGMLLLGNQLVTTNTWVSSALSAKFPLLFIDEYQDLAPPFHDIVVSLLRAGSRVFAVGDPDQSIYSFTGADPGLIENLSRMEGVRTIRLRLNYRSGSVILSASEFALGETRGYRSENPDAGQIFFYPSPTQIERQAESAICEVVPAILARASLDLSKIAVLYPAGWQGTHVAAVAESQGIPYVRIDKNAAYRKGRLNQWIEECAKWCGGGWRRGQPRMNHLLAPWLDFQPVQSDEARQAAKLKLVGFLSDNRDANQPAHRWLERLESACLSALFATTPGLSVEQGEYSELLGATRPGGPLASFTVRNLGSQGGATNHINLMTLHAAKGLEFDAVVIIGLNEGILPHPRATTREQLGEARRVFYVGLTRAKREVHLLYSAERPSPLLGDLRRQLETPSTPPHS